MIFTANLPFSFAMAKSVNFNTQDARITLHGSVPKQTSLKINAQYASPTCTGDETIVIRSNDEETKKKKTVSFVRKIFPSKENAYPYNIDLPYSDTGECRWQLTQIAAQFFTDSPDKSPSYVYFLRVNEAYPHDYPQDIAITPTVYTINYNETKNGTTERQTYLALSDSEPLPWMVKKFATQTLILEEGHKLSVNLSPRIMTDYVVHVTNVLSTDKKGHITITYPDGTTFFYGQEADKPKGALSGSRYMLTVFGPENPESQINSLAKASDPTSKVTLAKIYESSVGIQQDKEKAALLYLDAANNGNTTAMRWLTHQAEVRHDEKQQSFWLHKLADTGDKSGQACLIRYKLCKGQVPNLLVDKLRALEGQVYKVSVRSFLYDYEDFYSSDREKFQQRWCDECFNLD